MFGNPELVDVKLSELTTVAAFVRVRDNPSSNGFIVVTRTTAPKLTVPPFNTNKTTTDHQQREPRATQPAPAQDDWLLGGTWHPMSLSFFPTTNRFVISSWPQQQQQHQTYSIYHQSTIQYKQNNNRSLTTRTSAASSYLCWRHRVFFFRYATSDNNPS